MAKHFFKVITGGVLKPDTQHDEEYVEKHRVGTVLSGEFKKPRNYEFHKKYFALLNIAYEAFEPVSEHNIQKNFEQFREDIAIQAGFYIRTFNLDGSLVLKAKSISFASMEEDEFDKLYNASVQVILDKVLTTYTRDDLDNVVAEVIRF